MVQSQTEVLDANQAMQLSAVSWCTADTGSFDPPHLAASADLHLTAAALHSSSIISPSRIPVPTLTRTFRCYCFIVRVIVHRIHRTHTHTMVTSYILKTSWYERLGLIGTARNKLDRRVKGRHTNWVVDRFQWKLFIKAEVHRVVYVVV
jgi:hypothetical protein